MNPTFAEIGMNSVLANAKVKLRIQNTTEHDSFLSMMTVEALESLNALSQLTKRNCSLIFTNGTAELPKDYVRYLALRIDIANDDTNDPINNTLLNGCQSFLYSDTNFLSQCGCDCTGSLNWNLGGFQILNGFIHMNTVSEVTTSTLAYLGVNLDKAGNPVILQKYERAISSYCCYQFALTWSDKYNQYVIEEYKKTWQAQRGKIIGQDAAQSFQDDKREIQNIWNAMLVSRLVNYNI